jgi:uncharacterized protein (TIGR02186 family)
MMRWFAPMVVIVAMTGGMTSAAAERLVVSLSNHRVAVTSSFTGEDLVLFGTIEPDAGKSAQRAYDLVVTMNGPREILRTRRKERVLGIWVNVDSREFVRVPSYLAILSNRPVTDIANPEVLRRSQVGLDNYLLPQRIGPDVADTVHDDPFRGAFLRLEIQQGLYRESGAAVTFLTPTVFRVAIPLPANAPTGGYEIDVKLFANGATITGTTTALEVIKTGVEQYAAEAAINYGLLYGLGVAMMALLIGWFGSVVFRRD